MYHVCFWIEFQGVNFSDSMRKMYDFGFRVSVLGSCSVLSSERWCCVASLNFFAMYSS
jgi:hypothetical protein